MAWERNIRKCMACQNQDRSARLAVCRIDGKGTIEHAEDGDCPMKYFTPGIGGIVAAFTAKLGIKTCGDCNSIKDDLDKIEPY